MTEQSEAFAKWLSEGPALAAAAGCFVGIKVTALEDDKAAHSGGIVSEGVYLSAVKGRAGFRQALKETRPVIAAALALRDKWRTPGQKTDSDDFFAAVNAVSEAVDAYDAVKVLS
jgi:hypothetical protein